MKTKEITHIRSQRDKVVGFLYVSFLFLVATVACCLLLHYYSNNKDETRKEFVIAKMDRIREFQNIQNQEMVIIDSIYNKIKIFSPGINASYEENDIKFYLNDIKKFYEENRLDTRYKIFQQMPTFYNMWFADKKELWSKRHNIENFSKNLESCQIGLQKKMDELKNTNK